MARFFRNGLSALYSFIHFPSTALAAFSAHLVRFPILLCLCISPKPRPILPGGLVHTRLVFPPPPLRPNPATLQQPPGCPRLHSRAQRPNRLGARLEVACWGFGCAAGWRGAVSAGWRRTFPEMFCHCWSQQVKGAERVAPR